jgi:hypothetical protein
LLQRYEHGAKTRYFKPTQGVWIPGPRQEARPE